MKFRDYICTEESGYVLDFAITVADQMLKGAVIAGACYFAWQGFKMIAWIVGR